MGLTLATLLQTARLSVERPRLGARRVLDWKFSAGEAWQAVGLMAVTSALLAEIGFKLAPDSDDPAVMEFFANPLGLALMQVAVMAGTAAIATTIGRRFGGTGSFAEALVLMGWLQAILLVLQLLQIVLILVLPPLAPLVAPLAMLLFGWQFVNFVAELHGFQSLGLVLLGSIGTMFVLSLMMALILVFVLGGRP